MIIAAYCNTLYCPPVLDDFHSFILEQNVYLKDISISSLVSISKTKFGWERWIPMLTFAIDHKMGNGSLLNFHVTNITVHILSFFSVFFFLVQLIRINEKRSTNNYAYVNKYTAVCIAGLWALNPVQTNAVTYLVQRMASIEALFYILSIALFLKGRMKHTESRLRRAMPFYVGCSLATFCAFLSKQNSAMIPFMLLMTELWFFRPDMMSKFIQRTKKVYWTIFAGCFLVVLLIVILFYLEAISTYITSLYSHRHFTLSQRLLTESRIIVWYMSLLLLPFPSRLSMEHDVVLSTSLLSPPTTLLSIGFILVLLWQTFRLRRRYPLITYGCLWFFMNLAIESTFLPLELVFEHRLYLPSVGFFISIVLASCMIARSFLRHTSQRDFAILSSSVLAILLSALTLMTFIRNEAWENPVALNWDAASKSPQNPRAHTNLAVALLRSEQFEKAIEEAEKAIALGQEHFEERVIASNVIVVSSLRLHDAEKAIQRGNELLENLPKNTDMRSVPILCLNIAESYFYSEKFSDAYRLTVRALDFIHNVRSPDTNFEYEKTQVMNSMKQILLRAADKNIDLDGDGQPDPGDLPVETWMAKVYAARDESELAKGLLKQAIFKVPEQSESLKMLSEMERVDHLNEIQKDRWSFLDKYVYHPFSRFNFSMSVAFLIREKQLPSPATKIGEAFLEYALRLEPDAADAHLLKAWYLFEKDEVENAVAEAKLVLDRDPDYAKAWLGLGLFLVKSNPEDAIQALNKALELYPGYSQRSVIRDLITTLEEKV